MSFSSQSFQERFKVLGDLCESKFEQWADTNNVRYERYGFNRPSFKHFASLPDFIRMTPDYVCEGTKNKKFLVECKGCGGRTLKIKLESLEGLVEWNAHLTVWFFVYNSKENAYALVNYRQMLDLCEGSPIKHFPNDNKAYYDISTKKFEWNPMEDEDE